MARQVHTRKDVLGWRANRHALAGTSPVGEARRGRAARGEAERGGPDAQGLRRAGGLAARAVQPKRAISARDCELGRAALRPERRRACGPLLEGLCPRCGTGHMTDCEPVLAPGHCCVRPPLCPAVRGPCVQRACCGRGLSPASARRARKGMQPGLSRSARAPGGAPRDGRHGAGRAQRGGLRAGAAAQADAAAGERNGEQPPARAPCNCQRPPGQLRAHARCGTRTHRGCM